MHDAIALWGGENVLSNKTIFCERVSTIQRVVEGLNDEKAIPNQHRCPVPGNGNGARKASYQVAMRSNRRIPP